VNSPLIPMDPMDFEALPPEDLDTCERCDGLGSVITGLDPETGKAVDEPCPWCGGTGDRWAGAA